MSSVLKSKLINDDKRPIYGVLIEIRNENQITESQNNFEISIEVFKDKIKLIIDQSNNPRFEKLLLGDRNFKRLFVSLLNQNLIEYVNDTRIKVQNQNLNRIHKLYSNHNIALIES